MLVNAVMKARLPFAYTIIPPSIALVNVVPEPVIVVFDCDAVPTAYVLDVIASDLSSLGPLMV